MTPIKPLVQRTSQTAISARFLLSRFFNADVFNFSHRLLLSTTFSNFLKWPYRILCPNRRWYFFFFLLFISFILFVLAVCLLRIQEEIAFDVSVALLLITMFLCCLIGDGKIRVSISLLIYLYGYDHIGRT